MAARGLDIQAVTTVVHYDVARVVDTFIHRAGRTAVGYFPAKLIVAFTCLFVYGMTMKIHLGLESLTSLGVGKCNY